jgi:hypothetical protein
MISLALLAEMKFQSRRDGIIVATGVNPWNMINNNHPNPEGVIQKLVVSVGIVVSPLRGLKYFLRLNPRFTPGATIMPSLRDWKKRDVDMGRGCY